MGGAEDAVVETVAGPQDLQDMIGCDFGTGQHLDRLVQLRVKGLAGRFDGDAAVTREGLIELLGDHCDATGQ